MLLNKKVVELNGFEREVGIKVDGNKMFGVLGQTRFVWAFTEHELPNVEAKQGADKLKAAKYGRLYILKRLEMEGVVLNIKTKEKTVEYLHIPEENGVWINAFENGYLRGCVNGIAFSWNPGLYKMAVAVNEAGFSGAITQKIDTDKIKARLRSAGYTSYKVLMEAVDLLKGGSDDPFKSVAPNHIDKAISVISKEKELADVVSLIEESTGTVADISNILMNTYNYACECDDAYSQHSMILIKKALSILKVA